MSKNRFVCALVILAISICSLSACSYAPKISEYSDISDYGKIIGTGTLKSNYRAKKEFYGFFPSEIDPSFEDVKYHYKAIDNYTYAFEASLEFKLPDDESFFAYAASVAPMEEFSIFPYDEDYLEYLPEKNSLSLYVPEPGEAGEGEGTEYYCIVHVRDRGRFRVPLFLTKGPYTRYSKKGDGNAKNREKEKRVRNLSCDAAGDQSPTIV